MYVFEESSICYACIGNMTIFLGIYNCKKIQYVQTVNRGTSFVQKMASRTTLSGTNKLYVFIRIKLSEKEAKRQKERRFSANINVVDVIMCEYIRKEKRGECELIVINYMTVRSLTLLFFQPRQIKAWIA